MNLVIDTNILVHAVNGGSTLQPAASAFLESRVARGGFCVTWSILYEWLRVVTHPRVFPRPLSPEEATSFVTRLVREPAVDILEHTAHHAGHLEEVFKDVPQLRGNLVHDAHIAALMREHGVSTIATGDSHFRLFTFLKTVNPLA